jgi:hypothetical protein
MDAIALLQRQHEDIEELFLRCDGSQGESRRAYFLALAKALLVHAHIEEEQFYVAIRTADTQDLLAGSESEHAHAKALVSQLAKTPVGSRQFSAVLAELRADIDAHIAEERSIVFPRAYRMLGVEGLAALGEAMEERIQELEQPGELPTFESHVPEQLM